MLKCNLSSLMGKYRFSIQDVHLKTGLSRGTITQLYHDRATRIDYDTIVKLCKLFNCSINDIFSIELCEGEPNENNQGI